MFEFCNEKDIFNKKVDEFISLNFNRYDTNINRNDVICRLCKFHLCGIGDEA